LGGSDAEEIERLSSSTPFLELTDSILASFDRKTLAEFLAGYLYFKSKGRANNDFVLFIMTKKFGKTVRIAMNITAALVPGLLFDKAFRSVIWAAAMEWIGKRRTGEGKGRFKSATSEG
jgi:hypothetical protein